FTHPTTGKSVPLVLTVLGTNDRVSLASSSEIVTQIESDIEAARTNLAIGEGITSHAAATAMAARIYFYHGKYDLAYERANEVISSGKFSLEANVADIYTKGSGSSEVIYSIIHNSSEQTFGPAQIGFNNHQADDQLGTTSLNSNGVIGQLRAADPTDKRFADLMSEGDGLVYLGGKWPTNSVDYVALRLAEMHLTRAEANIMVNNAVTADDVADVNAIINRAGAATSVVGTPNKTEMLEIIFNERSKELYNEWGDRFLNTRRLQKGIVNENGSGQISYSTYSQILYYPLPVNEVEIHNLQ
ncbi:MAG: RagB/SusD family nutrient uptake outer membrane protein, partial [Flavobacteriaceae bacterium]|nr:RagB/SusD family nutrient uptake outer membrane protein [Flavobacteriaceae bacterium]